MSLVYIIVLDAVAADGLRPVSLRGSTVRLDLPEPARSARAGSGWGLVRSNRRWIASLPVAIEGTRPSWPAIPDVVAAIPGRRVELALHCTVMGGWSRDAAGRAVEYGRVRTGPGTECDVLSYAGWQLSALEPRTLSFIDLQLTGWGGLVLPPSSVELDDATLQTSPSASAPTAFGSPGPLTVRSSLPDLTPRAHVPTPITVRPGVELAPRPWERVVSLLDLTFHDGAVSFEYERRTMRVEHPASLAAMETATATSYFAAPCAIAPDGSPQVSA